MGCYLITPAVLRKGRYEINHEARSLARLMSEAQALVASARGRASAADLHIYSAVLANLGRDQEAAQWAAKVEAIRARQARRE
jgi:hypothetical protein